MKRLKVLNMIKRVNFDEIRKTFLDLKVDLYVKGSRSKQVVRYTVGNHQDLLNLPLSLNNNPAYNYPEFKACPETLKVVEEFVYNTKVQPYEEVLVEAQRTTCKAQQEGLPSDWHNHGVKEIGLACVSRFNIKGGVSELRDAKTKEVVFSGILSEGTLLIFEDACFEHRATPISVLDERNVGHRDVLLLSYPPNRDTSGT